MSFLSDNRAYENWLRKECRVVEADLRTKHRNMRSDPFVFLRATFFRWAKTIEAVCPELAKAPAVLSIGDVHIENFGTWRDAEGRLVWGINDFDETAEIAYPFDLVRLATSAALTPRRTLSPREIATSILDGYRRGLAEPRATLLDEDEPWARPLIICSDRARRRFWLEADNYPAAKPPRQVAQHLKRSMPEDSGKVHFAARLAGGGSLGRPRYVAMAEWRGDHVVREAKALVPSAWLWAHGVHAEKIRFMELATGKYRSPDPFLHVHEHFIYRRLAADSRKVELNENRRLSLALFSAMGFDVGAIHAADPHRKAVLRDLDRRPKSWLYKAAKAARESVIADYEEWRRNR